MPMTPDKLDTRVVTVTFPFGDDEMTIKYRPRGFSNDRVQRAQQAIARIQELNALMENPKTSNAAREAAAAEADQLDSQASVWIADILVWWDYVECFNEDGTPGPMVPITPARISQEMQTHTDFVNACLAAAAEDYNKGKPNGAASSPPSAATSLRTVR